MNDYQNSSYPHLNLASIKLTKWVTYCSLNMSCLSGVQRLLDARGNEVLGCPLKYFLFVSQNFWRPFFSRSPIRDSSPKISDASWMPLSAASCPGKTGPLDAPKSGCPGPSHRPHPSARHCLILTSRCEQPGRLILATVLVRSWKQSWVWGY